MNSLPKDNRHPADYRDEIEHAEVVAVLSELPEDHPACVSYSSGHSSDSIALTHLLADRMDLVKRLVDAYLAHGDRIWEKAMHTSDIGSKSVEELRARRDQH